MQETVFVIDDDPIARSSLASLVESYGGQSACYESADSFLNEYDGVTLGCIVTDLRMRGMSGIDLHKTLVERAIAIPVVLLTAYANTPLTVQAMRSGIVGVFDKPFRDDELWDGIRYAMATNLERRNRLVRHEQFLKGLAQISPSERKVLDLLVEGTTNKAIASTLNVSVRTVESRRQRIGKAFKVQSFAHLVRMYVEAEFAGFL